MTGTAFDGSTYRRTVLTPLRSAAASNIDDLFWLGHVPREVDDDVQIAAHLKSTKAFLHKERSRPRQADVAAAVLREWPRVEGVLGDRAARASLRARLGDAPPGAEVAGAGQAVGAAAAGGAGSGSAADAGGATGADGAAGTVLDPAARRRRQAATALGELARLRDEPELAEDLFAFLGLPVTATADMLRGRIDKVGEVNRRRRPDRERSLVDELLMHCRELLVEGDPAVYRAGLAADAAGVPAAAEAPSSAAAPAAVTAPAEAPRPVVDIPETFVADDGTVMPVSPPPWNGSPPSPPKVDYTRRPKPKPAPPEPEPVAQPASQESPAAAAAAATPDGPPPAVQSLRVVREGQGVLRLTWDWPLGVTEAFVAVGAGATPDSAEAPSRKVTNTKYELDGGALLSGVTAGATLKVFSGRRDQAGGLTWAPASQSPATIAP